MQLPGHHLSPSLLFISIYIFGSYLCQLQKKKMLMSGLLQFYLHVHFADYDEVRHHI